MVRLLIFLASLFFTPAFLSAGHLPAGNGPEAEWRGHFLQLQVAPQDTTENGDEEEIPESDPEPTDEDAPETEPEPADEDDSETEPEPEPIDDGLTEPDPTTLESPTDTTAGSPPPDTMEVDLPSEIQDEPDQQELREVDIWPDPKAPGFETVETDSTMRWFMALVWSDRLYREPGVITYRTGMLGQPSGMDIHSYEKRHQKLYLNEMNLTDPVTGQVNWNRLPMHKIRTINRNSQGYGYQARAELREYYTVQPRTYLNFDEGGGNYRNLEFSFTHNLRPESNLELSFWDRQDGSRFPRSELSGRQIVAKARHHLTPELMLKAGYINNGLDNQQSFGYNTVTLHQFNFNPFAASPMEPGASSNLTTNDLYLQLHQRTDEESSTSRSFGVNYQTTEWDLEYSQDTTAYSIRTVEAYGWQELITGPAVHRATVDVEALRESEGRSLGGGTWIGWSGGLRSELDLFPWLKGSFEGSFEGRDDGYHGYQASAALRLEPTRGFYLEGFTGTGSALPDLQALYWQSEEFSGNASLQNENGMYMGVSSALNLGPWMEVGVRGDIREVNQGIFPDTAGVFSNIDPYTNLSATAWLELDAPVFEGYLSGTVQQFSSTSSHPVNVQLNNGGERAWVKGGIYWKNYLFSRATYVKAGVSGMATPGGYAPAALHVPLNRWQHGVPTQTLPAYHRLDGELSARIRWFMLMVRWENLLNGVTQPGYFEADAYPMPGRRLIVAFRIVFTN